MRLILLFLLLATSLCGTIYYVDNTASGANDGTSWTDAWETTGAISWGSISPGDVIYFAENTSGYGTITVGAQGNSATVAGRIWLVGQGTLSIDWSGSAPTVSSTTLPTVAAFAPNSMDYIGVVGFEITSSPSKSGTAIDFQSDTTGWLVQDCYIHHKGSAVNTDNGETNSYHTFRGNFLQDLNDQSSIQFGLQGHHNILEYTHMGRGADRLRMFQYLSIYRNNYFTAMLVSDLTGTDPHIDDVQVYRGGINAPYWSDKNVVEAIFSRDAETSNAHFLQVRDELLTGDYNGLIARLNVVYNMNSLGENQNMGNERGYNNTFVDLRTNSNLSRWFRGANVTAADNIWINNSFTNSNANSGSVSPLYTSDGASITAEYNHEYLSGNLQGLNNVEDTAPSFIDEPNQNYMPTSGSPLRAAQRYMTLASGSGSSSTALTVDDSDFFIDGWGIVEGDLIKIGSGDWVRISAINYGTEAITLAEARSWSDNAEVYLFGTEDSMGAFSYRSGGYTVSGTLTTGSPNVVAVNDSDLVRMVIFYEDGVPQDPDYDAPYQYTDGGGTVTAKIYSRFASETPVIEASTGADVTAPTISAVAVASDGLSVAIVFSESVSQGTGYNDSDLDLDASVTGSGITLTYGSGDGSNTWIYTAGTEIQYNDTVDIDFNGDADSIEDAAGNDLAAVISGAVTNNSTQGVAGTVATPVLDLAEGPYYGTQSLGITTATAGASIYYVTDGSTPDAGDTLYSGTISLSTPVYVRAIGIKAGDSDSTIASGVYEINTWTVADEWKSFVVPQQTGSFPFSFRVTPNAGDHDLTIGFGPAAVTTWAEMAVIIRFANTGVVDARNGGSYTAVNVFNYSAGESYLIEGTATMNGSAGTFSASVNGTVIATDYAFRTEQAAVTDLDYVGMYSQTGDFATVSNLSFDASVANPRNHTGPTGANSSIGIGMGGNSLTGGYSVGP